MKECFKPEYIFTLIGIFINNLLFAQVSWEELNPGAGGQVQDIVCDPSVNGRLFLVSDMEGIYRSTDNGISWQYTSDDLIHHRTFDVTPDPSNSNRVYAGTLAGIHISDNGGINWRVVNSSIGVSIGAIAVNPNDKNHVIAATGWRDDYNFGGGIGSHDIKGPLVIFQTRDGGKNWARSEVNSDNTDPNTYTITFHPNNVNIVYIAGAKGLYKSVNKGSSWSFINSPNQTFKYCTGLGISPNGQYIYTTWISDPEKPGSNSKIYASKTQRISWKYIGPADDLLEEYPFWYPEVDPRSSTNVHKVILPILKERPGLFELSIDWNTGNESPKYTWKQIWNTNLRGYDSGWEYSQPGPRVAHYTPKTWNQRAVWSTINQSMLRGLENSSGNFSWQNRYSIRNENINFPLWGDTQYSYSSRGTASTFTYDIAADRNYVIQGQADNGFMESWDFGNSWSNVQGRSKFVYDARAVAIASLNEQNVVLAQGGSAFGGNANTATLFMKKLNNYDPTDTWEIIGAGKDSKGNLPYDDLILEISVDPKNKERIFISYDTKGTYLINNLSKFIEGIDKAVKISGASIQGVREIAFDPDNSNIIYATVIRGDEGLYKINWNSDSFKWEWEKIAEGRGWGSQVKVWKYQGRKYILYTAKNLLGNTDYSAALIQSDGTIKIIFNPEMAKQLRTNKWYPSIQDRYKFDIGGVAVFNNQIFLSYYNHQWSKGYGLYKGTLQNNGSFVWEDWTANNHFKGGTDAEVFSIDGDQFYYQGTQGVGMWRRKLEAFPDDPDQAELLSGMYRLTNNKYKTWLDGDENGQVDQSTNEGISKNWELIHQKDNVYKLKNVKYGQWLTTDESGNVFMSSDKTGTQRNWIASKIDEHIITLQNQFTKKFLDADSNGEIDVSDSPQLDDQWILVKTEADRNYVEGNSVLLKIYPNPVVDKLNISYPENFNPVLIKIYDLQGKKINEIKTLENSNFNEEIDVTNLIDGLYVIEVFFEDYNSIKKQFIIRN